MPITVEYPADGAPFGPGFRIKVSSTLVGPPAVGFKWQIDLRSAPPGEAIYCRWGIPTPDVSLREFIVGDQQYSEGTFGPVDPRMPLGQPAQLQVVLLDGTQVQESTLINVVTDYTSGVPYILQQLMGQTQGGLTVEQAAQLQTTTEAMAFTMGGGLLEGAANLLNLVGKRLFNDVLIVPDRSGEGRLTKPGPLGGVDAFGLQWQVVELPSGFGIDEGAPDQTEIDWGQLSYMYDSEIGMVPADSKYQRSLNGRWNWGLSYPDAIDYFIMPGAVVRFWWIVIAPFDTAELAAASPNPK